MHIGRATGTVIPYRFTMGNQWETGHGTLNANGTLARSPTQSSNNGSLVNFPSGTGEIVETAIADEIDDFARLSQGVEASALAAANAVTSADFLLVVQGGVEKRVAIDTLKTYFAGTSSGGGSVATAPGAPTIGTATAGDGQVSVAFTAGSNGGSAITGHTATLYKVSDNTAVASASGSSSPISVPSANGLTVYAKVKSTNAIGTGPESAASNNVTPAAATATTYETLGNFTGVVASGTNPEIYHGNGTATQDYMEGGATLNKHFAANTDGYVIIETIGAGNTDWTLGVTSAATPSNSFGQCTMGIRNSYGTSLPYGYLQGNAGLVYGGTRTVTNTIYPADGDRIKEERIESSGGGNTATMIYSVARASTPNTFVEAFRCTNFPCEALFVRWYVIGSPYVTKIVSSGLV